MFFFRAGYGVGSVSGTKLFRNHKEHLISDFKFVFLYADGSTKNMEQYCSDKMIRKKYK